MGNGAFGAMRDHGAPLVVGFSLMLAWSYAPLLAGKPFYMGYHLGFFAAALLLAFAKPVREVVAARPATSWAAAGLCALASLGTAAPDLAGPWGQWAGPVAGATGGAGAGLLFARWFMAFCYEPVKTSVVRVLFAFAGSGALRCGLLACRLASPLLCGALLAALPLSSLAVLRRGRPPEHKKAWSSGVGGGALQRSQEIPRFFTLNNSRLLIAEVFIFGLAMGCTRSNFSHWSLGGTVGLTSQLLQVLVPLVLYWWFAMRAEQDRREPAVRALMVLAAVGVLALFVFANLVQYALSAVSLCTSTLVLILMYIRMLDAVSRSGTHPFVAFGLVRGSLELSIACGVALFWAAGALGAAALLSQKAATFVIGTMLILLVNSFSLRSTWEFLDEAPVTADPLAARSSELAQTYRLTEAEAAVMAYLCQGRSKKYIAAELAMSEDSVRYHAKQLYRKLDVHSREELMTVAGL